MVATVTTKGQVTIPKAVRDLLGLKPGSEVEFRQTQDGRVELKPLVAEKPKSRFRRLRGHAGEGLSTDELLALTRGDA